MSINYLHETTNFFFFFLGFTLLGCSSSMELMHDQMPQPLYDFSFSVEALGVLGCRSISHGTQGSKSLVSSSTQNSKE